MRLKLPPKVNFIIDIFRRHGFEAYAVGGCIRDLILAREPEDFDITTSAVPKQIKSIFHHTVDTGIEHGTVTVLIDGEPFEVTTYRVDGKYTDGRHPDTVRFTPSLKEDLKRRDFTINAMAYNENIGLVDFYGGMADLQSHVIRCVGDANARFDEDALRIMRAVRFAAQLDFKIDRGTYDAIRSHVQNLSLISEERIQTELVKLLVSPHPEMLEDLYKLGITKVILPEFDRCMDTPQNTPHHIYSVGEHTIHTLPVVPCDRILRLTMLLHDFGKPDARVTDSTGRDHFKGHAKISTVIAKEVLQRLRFDNETIRTVCKLIYYHDLRPKADDASVRKAIYYIGKDLFSSYLSIQWADTSAQSVYRQEEKFQRIRDVDTIYMHILGRGDPLTLKDLSINGNDLLAMGISGREVGDLLESAMLMVLSDPALNTKEALMQYVRTQHIKEEQQT